MRMCQHMYWNEGHSDVHNLNQHVQCGETLNSK